MSTKASFETLDPLEKKRIFDKLAKLKALSECRTGNVNETATAAAAMMRIMLEYEIQMADLQVDAAPSEVGEESVFMGESLNGFPRWQSSLLNTLAEVNHCQAYKSSRTVHHFFSRSTESFLMLIGTESDMENTRKLFFYCITEIEHLCQTLCVGRPVKWKNDFKRGASRGVADKVRAEHDRILNEEREKARAQGASSVALELFGRKARAVQQYAAELDLVSTTARVRAPSQDPYRTGYVAGSNLDLGNGSQLLLTDGR